MSSPSNPEHTDSRVDAAVSLEHASGSLGDCESLAHARRCLVMQLLCEDRGTHLEYRYVF